MLTNTRITVALFILTFTGCLLSQEVGRRPGTGGSTNIYTSSINGIDTVQLHTNSAGILGINNGVPLTNAYLKATTTALGLFSISNATPRLRFGETGAPLNAKLWEWGFSDNELELQTYADNGTFGASFLEFIRSGITPITATVNSHLTVVNGTTVPALTNTSLTVGRVMIVGSGQEENVSSITATELTALSGIGSNIQATINIINSQLGGSGGSFVLTLNGPATNLTTLGTFTNRAIVIYNFDNTNNTDKDFRTRYSDYKSATNMFAGIRGKSTSSNSDVYIGSDPDAASPGNIYFGTGPYGWLNQDPQWIMTGTGSPRVYGQFNPKLDHTNDIGTAALRLSDIHMADNLIVDEGGFGVFYGGGSATPELNKTGAKGAVYQRAQFGTYKKVTDAVSSDNSKGWVYQPTTIASGITNLSSGTITINNSFVAATALIFITHATPGGTQGFLSSSISAGTSFTINSSSGSDTSSIYYEVKQ